MPRARRAYCSASSDCPSRRFFRHSLKSFIPASEGDVVPIQWDIGSFLNPAGTSRVTEGRVPARSARANRTDVQLLGYSLLLAHWTGKHFYKVRSADPCVWRWPVTAGSPPFYWAFCELTWHPRPRHLLRSASGAACESLCRAIHPEILLGGIEGLRPSLPQS